MSAPLSFAQERLWLHHRLHPDDDAYNVPLCALLRGALPVHAVRQAIGEIVRRHAVLRTVYRQDGERAVQSALPARPAALPIVDLTALDAPLAERTARRLATEDARRPFDLRRGPVVRPRLLRHAPDRHRLLLTRHHIASDGWSLSVIGGELSALASAFGGGRPSPLADLPLQYADYAAAERAAPEPPGLAWWRERLGGARGSVSVLAPGASAGAPAARVERVLERETVSALGGVARSARTTLFGVLLAAWGHTLGHAGGDAEVTVGVAVAGRPRSELEPLVGSFVKVLPLRLATVPRSTFRTVAARAGAVLAAALDHADVPVERIAAATGRTPLFEAVLVLQNAPLQPMPAGLEATLEELPPVAPKYPLALTATSTDGRLLLALEHDRDRLDVDLAAALVERFVALLEAAAAAPERTCAALLGAGSPPRPPSRPACEPVPLHRQFERAARRAPDAVAVTHRGAHVSYGALDARAERLAGALGALGVGPESLVGVCAEPSADLVAAILGVLKAGGAYVPLSPPDPPARSAALVAGARPAVVVGERRLLDRIGPLPAALALDEPQAWPPGAPGRDVPPDAAALDEPHAWPPGAPRRDVPPDAAAYVVHTSGTTGAPKGVVVTHANVARLFAAVAPHLTPAPGDAWLLAHSIAFDFSVWELWGALAHGGRLVVADRDVVRSPAALWRVVDGERVTVLSQTPSAFAELARHATGSGALTHVVLGGERCEPAALRPWAEAHGLDRPALLNLYGITETTVHATAHRIVAADLDRPGRSPIGRPLADLDAVVEDGWGRGELLVGGAGVARGYLRAPAGTAERFVPAAGGARRYRSGDVVRVLPGGALEYLGRADDQIDLRGHRIEPAEVEAALRSHPAVRDVAVALRELDAGRPALVAYVAGGPVDAVSLLLHAASQLPPHMVPARAVALDRLPLTANGKLDRAALPDPAPVGGRTAPRTPTERALIGLWRELTGGGAVDLDTGLLELGADSLLLARLHARLADAFGVDVPLREVFDARGLGALAGAIDAQRAELERLVAEVERMSDEEVRRLRS